MKIGKRIKSFREAHKLTQQELADSLGVNRTAIAQIENGGRKVSVHELVAFASVFGITVDMLAVAEDSDLDQRIESLKIDNLIEEAQAILKDVHNRMSRLRRLHG